MWTIDAFVKPALIILREAGTLLFLIAVIKSYPDPVYKKKLSKWLGIWLLIFAFDLLIGSWLIAWAPHG